MLATVVTREPYPLDYKDSVLTAEMERRIRAGAIRSDVEVTDKEKVLVTEWNVLADDG